MAKADVDNTAALGFEAKLWHAAEGFFGESAKLEAAIRKNLNTIGYEV